MDSLFSFFSQVGKGFQSLPPQRKVVIMAAGLMCFASILGLALLAGRVEYGLLYSNLSPTDAGKIISKIKERKIVYRLSAGGDSILVPNEKVSELRMDLASEGLPQGGGIGFEIFDARNIGVTEFAQQLNYQRALQGELSRTINSLDEIEGSRVHIVIPKKSLFIDKDSKPSASVVVKLHPSKSLKPLQIEGIVHLVAMSVEGLAPDNVIIVDNRGTVLSKRGGDTTLAKTTSSQAEFQRTMERDLADRLQSMLERVVGQGKVVARVSAMLDFKMQEKTEEIFDPAEPVVRNMQRRVEKASQAVTGGQSTIQPAAAGAAARPGSGLEKTDESISYEINRTISKTVMPMGEVLRLSVAILVDGVYEKNDKGVEEFRPRSKKEMTELEGLVKTAVGFNADRGDQVALSSIPFRKELQDVEPEAAGMWDTAVRLIFPMIKYVLTLVVILLVVLLVVRPLVRTLSLRGSEEMRSYREATPALEGGRLSAGHVPAALEAPAMNDEVDLLKVMASKDSQKFAELLRHWLK